METPVDFDWYLENETVHGAKHGVSFRAGARVFVDGRRLEIRDDRFDYGETRLKAVGLVDGIYLTVVFTMRGTKAWIISVRRASRKERSAYVANNDG